MSILYSSVPGSLGGVPEISRVLEAKRLELAATWKTNGYYLVPDLERVVRQTWVILDGATKDLDTFLGKRFTAKDTAMMQRNAVSKMYSEGLPFVQAMNAAKNSGIQIVDAPGLKRWVLKCMVEAEASYELIASLEAAQPWFLAVMEVAYDVWDTLVAIVKKIVAVTGTMIAAAGSLILKVPDTLATVATVAKYGLLAFGALWLLKKAQERA